MPGQEILNAGSGLARKPGQGAWSPTCRASNEATLHGRDNFPASPVSLLVGFSATGALRYVSLRSARLHHKSLAARDWMDLVSLRLRWRKVMPGGASERSPASCAGCFSLMPRRRSSKSSPSCRARVCLKASVWAARGRVAMHEVLAIRARVGRCGSPSPRGFPKRHSCKWPAGSQHKNR